MKNTINARHIGQVVTADTVGTVTYTPAQAVPAGAEGVTAKQEVAAPPAPAASVKVLFLGANPLDTTRLALGQEVREVEQRLRDASAGGPIRVHVCQEWAVRTGDLQACLLRHRPAIVHFSGHAESDGELVLEDERGRARPVSPTALADLFRHVSGDVRGVVMNACFSDRLAEALVERVEHVVGMTAAITDRAAIAFAASYYRALGFGESVATAFGLGCNQIRLDGLPGADVPKLRVRTGVRPETLRVTHWFAPAPGPAR